ncbi:DUF5996 family protein [Primorskyibacter marinus]|uniref:DUF5996 family protein n=1 Tax=Primorskyibacter marinus TaxID=1977320 RepID=UPI0034DD07B3
MFGKNRLAHTPWVNHSWHAMHYMTPRGLTTGPVHELGGASAGASIWTITALFPKRTAMRARGFLLSLSTNCLRIRAQILSA